MLLSLHCAGELETSMTFIGVAKKHKLSISFNSKRKSVQMPFFSFVDVRNYLNLMFRRSFSSHSICLFLICQNNSLDLRQNKSLYLTYLSVVQNHVFLGFNALAGSLGFIFENCFDLLCEKCSRDREKF